LEKKIHRHSNVELLDILKNSSDQSRIVLAQTELEKRDLSQNQKDALEMEYQQFLEYREKRRTESLTTEEFFHFFFFSVFASNEWTNNNVAEMESERFEKFGFEKKQKEAAQAQLYGFIFWILIGFILLSIFEYL